MGKGVFLGTLKNQVFVGRRRILVYSYPCRLVLIVIVIFLDFFNHVKGRFWFVVKVSEGARKPFFAFRVFWVATLETTANRPRNGGFRGWPLKAKNRGTLLFRALGGSWDKGQHGQKMKNFWKKIFKILIVIISVSAPSI